MNEISIGQFNHVGVAVANIEQSVEMYVRCFGAVAEGETFTDELQQVRLRFLDLGGSKIELLEPLSETSPLQGLVRRGIGLYHICHEVSDLNATLEHVTRNGAKIISPPKPAIAFQNRRVAFVMLSGLMVEFLEATNTR